LKVDTRIHLGVGTNNLATRQITAARLLETPGPAYLPTAVYAGPDGPDTRTLREDGYVLENEGTHPGAPGHGPSWGVHLIPLEVMQAGDIFTIEMTLDTGEVGQYSRMINYVFKSIPRLVRAGAAGSLHDFDVTDPAMNGTPEHPILFDGTQDLVLVFNPPKDETGAYITGMDYHIEVFFVGSGPGAGQLSLDFAATWPTPPPHLNEPCWYEFPADTLGPLAADDTYTITLPIAVLPDTIHTQDGTEAAVGLYKMDLTAICPTGNAAINLNYRKN